MMPSDSPRNASLQQVFPCLGDHDVMLLLDMHGPNEVLKDFSDSSGRRTLRFRSQTAGGTMLILVSDVTRMRTHEVRRQQIARLELIGRIARGVANDFSNILSGISAHTALLLRLKPGSPEIKESISTILRETEKGAHLAGHLLEFSRLRAVGYPTDNLEEHVKKAGDLVRVGLSPAWKVETTVETDLPPVSLSGLQVEQVVLNLGLVAADAMPKPGILRITAGKPSQNPLMDIDSSFAAVIVISAAKSSETSDTESSQWVDARTTTEDAGVILSVARSLLEEAGGFLDVFAPADGTRIYRMSLPYGSIDTTEDVEGDDVLSPELLSYVSRWHVLLARSTRGHDYLEDRLREANANVERVNNIISALGRIETGQGLHAIVVEENLLGDEAAGLLRAIVKLCPTTGVVMLSEDPKPIPASSSRNVVLVSRRSSPTRIIKAMVEAKAQAAQRQGE
jgi:signal transduction histidine kinase